MNILDWLLPDSCPSCLGDVAPSGPPLCRECRDALLALEAARAPRDQCPRVTRAAFRYAPPLPRALYAFKYDSRLRVGRSLADMMGDRWSLYPELGIPHALVPVPLHPRKRRVRGFNQAAVLAEGVSKASGIPALELLRRRTNDTPQARRSRDARVGRLTGAFAATAADLGGARLVLIDDVATSGETLRACAKALLQAGAVDVRAYVLALGST